MISAFLSLPNFFFSKFHETYFFYFNMDSASTIGRIQCLPSVWAQHSCFSCFSGFEFLDFEFWVLCFFSPFSIFFSFHLFFSDLCNTYVKRVCKTGFCQLPSRRISRIFWDHQWIWGRSLIWWNFEKNTVLISGFHFPNLQADVNERSWSMLPAFICSKIADAELKRILWISKWNQCRNINGKETRNKFYIKLTLT